MWCFTESFVMLSRYVCYIAAIAAIAATAQEVVAALLQAGADPNTALLDAVKAGHTGIIRALCQAGGIIQVHSEQLACSLCSTVKAGDEALLRSYLAAGADASVADYAGRTPLHIAAMEDNLAIASVLVELGGADLDAADRWGTTPAAEARRAGAVHVADYLCSSAARRDAAAARTARRADAVHC